MREKRINVIFTIALFALILIMAFGSGAAAADDRLEIVVSFAVLYDFVTFIGGDRVNVSTMVEFGGCPCCWDIAPSDIKKLVRADMFIHLSNLVDLWIDTVIAAAGNPYLVVVESAKGIPIRFSGGVGDPHLWLDPINAKSMVNTIMFALIMADPAGESLYVENATRLQRQLSELDKAFRTRLADLPLREFIVFHQALDYFAARYGLVSHPLVRFGFDRPSPGRIVELVRIGRKLGIRYILTEDLGKGPFKTLADEINAETLLFYASPVSPREEGEELSAYVTMMYNFLDNLVRALGGQK